MAQLTGKGAPTRKTMGAIGDTYIDTTTKKMYECVFSYRDNTDNDFDCQWKELNKKFNGEIPKKHDIKKDEIDTEDAENTHEDSGEEVVEEPENKQSKNGRVNYSAYSNRKKK